MVPASPAMSAGTPFGGAVPGMDYGMKNLGGMLQQMLSGKYVGCATFGVDASTFSGQ